MEEDTRGQGAGTTRPLALQQKYQCWAGSSLRADFKKVIRDKPPHPEPGSAPCLCQPGWRGEPPLPGAP